jgi:hypothetical protein
MDDRKAVAAMVGDSLREAAVPVLVFFPLDWVMSPTRPLPLPWLTGALLASALLLFLGIVLERSRKA